MTSAAVEDRSIPGTIETFRTSFVPYSSFLPRFEPGGTLNIGDACDHRTVSAPEHRDRVHET